MAEGGTFQPEDSMPSKKRKLSLDEKSDGSSDTNSKESREIVSRVASMDGKSSKKGTGSASYDYTVHVHTGDRPKAGTDANVHCILNGEGKASKKIKLDVSFQDDFKRGQLNKFAVKKQAFATVDSVELWGDTSGVCDDWNIDTIMVINETTQSKTVFPVFRWIRADHHCKLIPLDTCLPQYDDRKDQRQKRLEEKRKEYQLEQKARGLPPQVKSFPRDEHFSFLYEVADIKGPAGLLAAGAFYIKCRTAVWKRMEDIRNIYTKHWLFPEPTNLRRWEDDVAFGLQRIAGVNNSFIKLCKQIPDKLGVTGAMLEPFLEGLTLPVALSDRRIFIVDHDLLDGCPTSPGTFTAAPIGLFYQKKSGYLVPIAIQLQQKKADDNPVFLPSDPKYVWIMAKMWFNNADTGMHQAIAHLGFTHLIMEGVSVITHRNISESHPIFKLLAPHFLYLIAINTLGLESLVEPGGWVDKTMTVAVKGLFELIRLQKPKWRMSVEGTLPADLKERGVDDLDILPQYHFREDALLLYGCIHKYVTDYVNIYYASDDVVLEDYELQNWRAEMVQPDDKGGLGLIGVAGQDGKFTNREQVAEVVTCVVFTCSVGHAAANFQQYDEYAFPPNYPSKMKGRPPKTKTPLTEKDVFDCLPDKQMTLEVMQITKILSKLGTNSLGDFEVNYIVDPKGLEVVEDFRANLKKASQTIQERNKTRNPPYPYLDPAKVPNSISI